MTLAVYNEFTMDPHLLVSVIKSQAGSLSKAILEGVMNSIDARASRVDVTLDRERLVIEDNGHGFATRSDIEQWFGRFGTPHKEGDAIYGRFRMGRGQLMAFASTTWRTGRFEMAVDIEARGMGYEFREGLDPHRGCRIEGRLYTPLAEYELANVLTELRLLVAYALKPVYVNGELYGAPAARLKSWTHEDALAYYRLTPDAEELRVYNQGVFVESLGNWKTGMGGVVVTKQALQVNFARNAVLENRCQVWRQVLQRLESLVLQKLQSSRKLTEGERKYLARRLDQLSAECPQFLQAKLLTDPSGKHLPLSALRQFRQFVLIEEDEPLACAVHGVQATFVVTTSLLQRFGVQSLTEWLRRLAAFPGVLPASYEVVTIQQLGSLSLGRAQTLCTDHLRPRLFAAFGALRVLNTLLAEALMSQGLVACERDLRLGHHKSRKFVAWTDGRTYITANRTHLKLFEKGLDGVREWLSTLIHEYTHDTDDSESHSHAEVFYRKFHDTLFAVDSGETTRMTFEALRQYVELLHKSGQGRPRDLVRQLKGQFPPKA